MRGYIHNNNNNNKTKSKKKKEQIAIHMYPHCKEWFHPKLDQRATPKLWNEVTLSSANGKFIVTGLLLVPPLRPPGCPGADVCTQTHVHTHTCTHTQQKKNPLVSPRRPPGREEGIAHWDTPLSCEGIGWRGRRQSSAGPSPSLAA